MAKGQRTKNSGKAGANPANASPKAAAGVWVEVTCEGRLGPKLLEKGDRTDDPRYVALINDPRNLVRVIEQPSINSEKENASMEEVIPTGKMRVKRNDQFSTSGTLEIELPGSGIASIPVSLRKEAWTDKTAAAAHPVTGGEPVTKGNG